MKSRDYDKTHKKILKSGKDLFLEVGYEKASVRDISKNAGVTTGAFYKHFIDKEALFTELVKPLIDNINKFYKDYEKKSFESYKEGDIKQSSIDQVLDLKMQASIETVKFLYGYKDICELLIFKSYGTKYNGFLDYTIAEEDKNIKKTLEIIHGKEKSKDIVSDEVIHIINHSYLHALSSIVSHAKSEEEAIYNTQSIGKFFKAGWKEFRDL